jgi:hypothetical protein
MGDGEAVDMRTATTQCRINTIAPASSRQEIAIARIARLEPDRSQRLNFIDDEIPQKVSETWEKLPGLGCYSKKNGASSGSWVGWWCFHALQPKKDSVG